MIDQLDQARTHIDRSQFDQAETCLLDYLRTNLNSWQGLFLLGTSYLRRGNIGLAVALLKQALTIRPDFPEAVLNLGTAYNVVHDNVMAEKYWTLAFEMEDIPKERADILSNMAGLYVNEGMPEKGLERVSEALAIMPDNASARFNRGLLLLEMGQWREAWECCEAGFATGDRTFRDYQGLPRWEGAKGQRIIVFGDQGVGDEIMYGSMLPDLIADCAHVIFDCHPRLVETWQRSFPGITVHGTRKLAHLDWHKTCGAMAAIALSSLGKLYRNEAADFPGTPYLVSTTQRQYPARPRIGISWRGGVAKTRADLRSIPLVQWEPLLRAIDAEWYSLQYSDEAAKEVCELEEATGIRIKHFPSLVQHQDYDRTIGFIAGLDLVISVCNTAVHAAGALGVPTWVLVPSKPGWRYAGETMPWYESVRIFRQRQDEDWASVIQRVAATARQHFHSPRAQNVA